MYSFFFFFFQAEDGIRDLYVTGVQTCALPILASSSCWRTVSRRTSRAIRLRILTCRPADDSGPTMRKNSRTGSPSMASNGTGWSLTPATIVSSRTAPHRPCGMATPKPMPVLWTDSRSITAVRTSSGLAPATPASMRVKAAIAACRSPACNGTTTRSGASNSVRSTSQWPDGALDKRNRRPRGSQCEEWEGFSRSARAIRLHCNTMPAAASIPSTPVDLLDRTPAGAREQLAAWVAGRSLPTYRVNQIMRRLWQAPVGAWAEATELPLALRSELDATFPLSRLGLEVEQLSADGTHKYLWRLNDGEAIES